MNKTTGVTMDVLRVERRRLVYAWSTIALLWFTLAIHRAEDGDWGWAAADAVMVVCAALVAFIDWRRLREGR